MKFLNHNLFTGDITVSGTTTLSTATGITRPTGDNTTHLATTEFVKAQGYATTAALSGYVPITRTITINGTTLDLSADRTWTIASGDYTSKVQHQVKAGVAINKGQAVYVTTSDGTNMIVGLASNATEATSSKTMGLLDATVAQNGFANVVTEGLLAGLNTVGATAGDPVWLGTGGNLLYGLLNKPYAPAHLVFIGIVTRVNANNGEIFVKVQNGFELNEIHDIDLKTVVPVNGHILGFDGTLWVNKTIATWLGYTPANASGTTNYLSKFTGSTTLGNSIVYDNGTNVGIGTTSPDAKLVIVGSGTGVAKIGDAGFGSGNYTGISLNGTLSTSNYNILSSPTDSTLYINRPTGATIQFRENNTTQVIIAASGNVGIGTITPASKLHIYQSNNEGIYLDGLQEYTTFKMLYGGNQKAEMVYQYSSDQLYFNKFGTGSFAFYGGNVGIGVTPTNKLQVANGDMSITTGYSFILADTDTNWRIGRNIISETGNQLTSNTMQFIAANASGQGWQFVDDDGGTRFEIEASTGNAWLPSGNLYLNGNLAATRAWVQSQGYLTSYTETDTLATVVARGNSTSSHISVDYIITTNNGAGTNVRLGDDFWMGDINLANTARFMGNQNNSNAYIVFGNGDATALGRAGTGALTYGGNTVYHSGNLTNLNQLTNGPGYITTESDTLNSVISRNGTTTGTAVFTQTSNTFVNSVAAANRGLTVYQDTTGADAYMTFHINSDYAGYFGLGGAENDLVWGGWSVGNARYRIWHSGNDGAGSGLDADTLDGLHASSFLTTETDTLASVTARGSSTTGSIFVNGLITGGLGAVTTAGTLDWNDVSNARSGSGYTLLLGTATNGMGGGQYYHPISFEYSSKNGSGNMTQLAIPYTGNGIWYRYRYGGSWGSWTRVWDSGDFTSTNVSNWNTAYGWGNHASQGYATQTYVNTAISNLVDAAPTTLDTLNELAAALGDDPNFATTVATSIGNKVAKAGDTMTGNLNWGATGLGLTWDMNTDGAYIKFFNTGNGDTDSRLEYATYDDGNEYHRWVISSVERMNLKAAGLTVTGNVTCTGTFTETSSRRFKENIVDLEPTAEKVEKLRPVRYNKIDNEATEIGLIAEEVAELFPEVVTYNENGQPSGVQYQRLSVILLKTVQELTERINKLENK